MVKKTLSLVLLLGMNFSMHGAAGNPQQLYIVTNEAENPQEDRIDAARLMRSKFIENVLQEMPGSGSSSTQPLHVPLSSREWNILKRCLGEFYYGPDKLEDGVVVADIADKMEIPSLLDSTLGSIAVYMTRALPTFLNTPGWTSSLGINPNFHKALLRKLSVTFTPKVLFTEEPTSSVAITPDGSTIVSGLNNGIIKLWDIQTGQLLRSLTGHTESVRAVTVTPDGSKVVSGSADKTMKIWDIQTGQLLLSSGGHTREVTAVAVTQDGGKVASGSSDATIRLYDEQTGQFLRKLMGKNVTSLAVTPDVNTIVSGAEDGNIRIWDISTGKLLHTLPESDYGVNSVVVTPDGRKIVSGGLRGIVHLWDIQTGQLVRTLTRPSGQSMRTLFEDIIKCVAVTPDGRTIVSGANDGTIKMWDMQTGQWLGILPGDSKEVMSMAVTPDGSRIVVGTRKGLTLWYLINWSALTLDQALLLAACGLSDQPIALKSHLHSAYLGLNAVLRKALGDRVKLE